MLKWMLEGGVTAMVIGGAMMIGGLVTLFTGAMSVLLQMLVKVYR